MLCQCHEYGCGFVKQHCNCITKLLGKHFGNAVKQGPILKDMCENTEKKFTVILRLSKNDNSSKLIDRLRNICKWPSNLLFLLILTTNDQITPNFHSLKYTHSKQRIMWYSIND